MSWSSSHSSNSQSDIHRRHPRPTLNHNSVSGSPRPSTLRPHWPWTSHSHRPSNSTSPLPGLISTPSAAAPVLSERLLDNVHWSNHQPTRSLSSTASTQGSSIGMSEEASTRQWNFTAFEWTIRNAAALRDFVETTPSILDQDHLTDRSDSGADDDGTPEVLRQCPMIGDNKFKVEVARTPTTEERSVTPTLGPSSTTSELTPRARIPTLSLYITALFLDFSPPEYEFCAAMMVAIKCQEDRAGERGARSDWVWEAWEQEFVFRKESEFWECQLPALSTMLQNPRISATDSFVLCIQIHSPVGPLYPQFPQAYYVPRDLLEGLESSLDNPNTGDVRFITLEHAQPSDGSPGDEAPHSRRSSSSSSYRSHHTARKRVIYAHSDILKRRSDYFATMLNSSFAESSTLADPNHTSRKVHEIYLLEADFVNVYWMLKWLYADWLLFKGEDDPQEVMANVGDGWSAKWLTRSQPGIPDQSEWGWKTIARHGFGPASPSIADARSDSPASHDLDEGDSMRGPRSAGSVSARSSVSMGGDTGFAEDGGKGKASIYSAGPSSGPTGLRPSRIGSVTSSSRGGGVSPATRRPSQSIGTPSKTTAMSVPTSSSSMSRTITGPGFSSHGKPQSHYSANVGGGSSSTPLSPRQARPPPSLSHAGRPGFLPHSGPGGAALPMPPPTPDPHPHPTPELPPASALAIYQIAHRYSMPGLQTLALEHMMNTITPKSAFPLLLATHFLDELHSFVEDYVVEHFGEVNRCDVFEKCCQEVAAGEWGNEGGLTLAALFRRLTPPNPASFRA